MPSLMSFVSPVPAPGPPGAAVSAVPPTRRRPLRRSLVALVLGSLLFSMLSVVNQAPAEAGSVDHYGCFPTRSRGRKVKVYDSNQLRAALADRRPGDDIRVAITGDVDPFQLLDGTGGRSGEWITIRAAKGHSPKINAQGFAGIQIQVPYIQVCGFEIVGVANRSNQTEQTKVGVAIIHTDHVRVADNEVYSFSSSGITANHSNNIEIVGNHVHHNSYWSPEQGSGISIFKPNKDRGSMNDQYQIHIAGNKVHHNINRVASFRNGFTAATDGNGIILDDFRNLFGDDGHGAFTGRSLVANNVIYQNGGRGIHAAPNGGLRVHIVNNTAYHNMQSLRNERIGYDAWAEAEISVAGAANSRSLDIKVVNNIAISDPSLRSKGALAFFRNNIGDSTIEEHHNSFNGAAERDFYQYPGIPWANGPHSLGRGSTTTADISFVNPEKGDFRLAKRAPKGKNDWNTWLGNQDIDNVKRPKGKHQERGAHEYKKRR